MVFDLVIQDASRDQICLCHWLNDSWIINEFENCTVPDIVCIYFLIQNESSTETYKYFQNAYQNIPCHLLYTQPYKYK